MIEIKLKDFQVGKTYYIHMVKDEERHDPVSLKYKAVCTHDYSYAGGWYEFEFGSVKGINTEDIPGGLGISIEEDRWGLYKYYLCQSDEIIERVIDRALKQITGEPEFTFSS
jgi:hypothetical protein